MIIHEKHTTHNLEQSDFDHLKSLGIDEIWYTYEIGGYEGSGQMIMRKGDLYDHHDMGHCSCFGPIDNMTFNWKPLPELKEYLEKNVWYWEREIKPVFEAYEL